MNALTDRTQDINWKKDLSLFFLAGLAVVLFINFKLFFVHGLCGFDRNGESNDVIPGLEIAFKSYAQGEFPTMNLFKNFGTPILGDCVTLPLAPHSFTYWAFSPHVASTINRSVNALLTIICLGAFLRRYMSTWAALFSALIVFGTSGYFHGFAIHIYQVPLLYLSLGLFLADTWKVYKRTHVLLLLQFTLILIVITTNFNVYLLCLGMFFAWFLSDCDNDFGQRVLISAGMLLFAVIFNFPDMFMFVQNIKASLRIEYKHGLELTTAEFLRAVFGYQNPKDKGVLETYSYIPLAVLIITLYGLKQYFREPAKQKFALRLLILGFIPSALVYVLVWKCELQRMIPLVRSTEITRILWVTAPLLGIALGKGLDTFNVKQLRNKTYVLTIVFVLIWTFCQASLNLEHEGYFLFLVPNIFLFGVFIFMRFALVRSPSRQFLLMFFGCLTTWSQWANAWNILGYWTPFPDTNRNSHYFSRKEDETFWPLEILGAMVPWTRLAAMEPSNVGHDQTCGRENIFGSAARGIVLDRACGNYFLTNGIASIDEMPFSYHFNFEADSGRLTRLGVRYLLFFTSKAPPRIGDWRLVYNLYSPDVDLISLYENQKPTSMAFLTTSNQDVLNLLPQNIRLLTMKELQWGLKSLKVGPINVSKDCLLVVLLAKRYGWKAKVDGIERPIETREDNMIRVPLHHGDKTILLQFEPFTTGQIIFCMMISVILSSVAWILFMIKIIEPRQLNSSRSTGRFS